MGLSGRVPRRVDAATKAGLLDLIDEAVAGGWTIRRACSALELGEVRAHRWYTRRARGRLADAKPGGSPMHGLLPEEAEEILALFEEWAEVDRSHRKLAHRGSYLGRVWVSPSTVRRVLCLADKHFRPLPRPGRSKRRQFPDWAEYTPNSIWIFDTTHFTRGRDGGADHPGPGLTEVDHRDRLQRGDLDPRSSSPSPPPSRPRGCWRPSTPATTTAWPASPSTRRPGRSCSRSPTTDPR